MTNRIQVLGRGQQDHTVVPLTTAEQTAFDAGVAGAPAVEAANQAQRANLATIRQRAAQALTDNAAFLALPAPTAAQAIPQVVALTRQVNALIRLTLGALDSTS